MVDVSAKQVTSRRAVAQGSVIVTPEIARAIRENSVVKGNVLEVARIGAIQAAKRTSEIIPLCHPIPLSHIAVQFELKGNKILITAEATAEAKTGVEMEALTAVSSAALIIYDMCKGIDKGIVISNVELIEKSGGKSGTYRKGTETEKGEGRREKRKGDKWEK
jgi:cyclic pyranopterin monophosphate synthase